ncbi:hypothetical protein HYS48_04095 [Candidatus Woesearchaeota archaeon]|nr:hypothetical protein [Candidatus Woesearchaeota archaeon]
MSLDDKLKPEDGGLLNRIDNALLGFHVKIAELWQDRTGLRTEVLAKYVHGFSAAACFASTGMSVLAQSIFGTLLSAVIGTSEVLKFAGIYHLRSPLMLSAREILPQEGTALKLLDVMVYGLGALTLARSATQFIYGLAAGELESTVLGVYSGTAGIGILFWGMGDYLDMIDLGSPKKKQKENPL